MVAEEDSGVLASLGLSKVLSLFEGAKQWGLVPAKPYWPQARRARDVSMQVKQCLYINSLDFSAIRILKLRTSHR